MQVQDDADTGESSPRSRHRAAFSDLPFAARGFCERSCAASSSRSGSRPRSAAFAADLAAYRVGRQRIGAETDRLLQSRVGLLAHPRQALRLEQVVADQAAFTGDGPERRTAARIAVLLAVASRKHVVRRRPHHGQQGVGER